tara:strand:+ start:872 stop:1312 length:441 start_codon:yes stop_codon:yes gene_type:complete
MLDVLMVIMSLIATFAMMFLAYFLYKYHIKITKLESNIAKFRHICANLNVKKDNLEDDIRKMRAGYQELWVKYNKSEENCKVISKLQLETNDTVLTYMKMVDELVGTIDGLVSSFPDVFSTDSFGELYARLKKRGKLVADIYDPES